MNEELGRFNNYMKPLDQKYDGTEVIKDLGTFKKSGERRAIFKCKYCNTLFNSAVAPVKSKATQSCGCYQKIAVSKANTTHGDSQSSKYRPIYRAWQHMIERCYKRYSHKYEQYGNIGITVCDEWLDKKTGYDAFKKWSLQNGWEKGLQIDKDIKSTTFVTYSPSTCSWVLPVVNMQHRKVKIGKTGYSGVTQDKRKCPHKSFIGQKTIMRKKITTKYFHTAEEAYTALQEKILLEE